MKVAIGLLLLVVAANSMPLSHFGVNLSLSSAYGMNYVTPSSWTPARGEYDVTDWYYGGPGPEPWSGDLYDVEAMYFDVANGNAYLGIVTSFPLAGVVSGSDRLVAGDIWLNLNGTTYGININNETRHSPNAIGGGTLGGGLYRTLPTDWYLGTPTHTPDCYQKEVSNFDPLWGGFGGTYLGNVDTSYSLYGFAGGAKEQSLDTYVIEATVPTQMFANWNNAQNITVSWRPGCSNDYMVENFTTPTPELGSLTLLGLGLCTIVMVRRKRD